MKTRLSEYLNIAIPVGLSILYIGLRARALNLDGLGYAGRVETADPAQLLLPGHLLYGPLMLAIYRLVTGLGAIVDASVVMQISDSVFGALGVGVFIAALRALKVSPFQAVAAGLALAFSYTYWIHSTDLTTYALSTLLVILAFYTLCRYRASEKYLPAIILGVTVAFAALIHQTNVLFIPTVLAGILLAGSRKRWRQAVVFTSVCISLVVAPYVLLGTIATGSHSPARIAKWAAGSAHGYKPQFEALNIARGVYGFANSIVYMDDIGTSIKGEMGKVADSTPSKARLLTFAGKSTFLLLLLGMSTFALIRGRSYPSTSRTWIVWVCTVWIVPYALFALFFFTTDHDRWIMLLPALWTLCAFALSEHTVLNRSIFGGGVAALCLLNLVSAIYPSHLGINNCYYMEARQLNRHLVGSDLVIFWGHDHTGTPGYLRQMKGIQSQHIFDLVLDSGKKRGLERLVDMVDDAIASNRRVVIVGLYGPRDRVSDYRAEAHQLKLTRQEVIADLDSFEPRSLFRMHGQTVYYYTGRRARPTVTVEEE